MTQYLYYQKQPGCLQSLTSSASTLLDRTHGATACKQNHVAVDTGSGIAIVRARQIGNATRNNLQGNMKPALSLLHSVQNCQMMFATQAITKRHANCNVACHAYQLVPCARLLRPDDDLAILACTGYGIHGHAQIGGPSNIPHPVCVALQRLTLLDPLPLRIIKLPYLHFKAHLNSYRSLIRLAATKNSMECSIIVSRCTADMTGRIYVTLCTQTEARHEVWLICREKLSMQLNAKQRTPTFMP
jgi:hypothetical protein